MNTGVGCHSLLQGIFLTQELNQGLLQCGQILYQLSYQSSPIWFETSINCTEQTVEMNVGGSDKE